MTTRGHQPRLVAILSAMESCASFQPRYDSATGRSALHYRSAKCLHYYFYFQDPELGLSYFRVPTWAPFRAQVYFNGHHWLAAKLQQAGVDCATQDNAFLRCADPAQAQALADDLDLPRLHAKLDQYAALGVPFLAALGLRYHWSLHQGEYSTDIIFSHQDALAHIYEPLARTASHAVKPEQIATFLGRNLHPNFQQEMGHRFSTRIEGTCSKHQMGPVSLKMYDKFGLLLRLETTVNDVTFFRHHRRVEQKNGESVSKLAPLKKSLYSLDDLVAEMRAANQRYLAYLSELETPSAKPRELAQASEPVHEQGRNYRGVNFFSAEDGAFLAALARGENHIRGVQNRELWAHLPGWSASKISQKLKSLRLHGLLKKAQKQYKYHLTALGRRVVLTGLKVKELLVQPQMAQRVALVL